MKAALPLLVIAGILSAGAGWLFTEFFLKDEPVQDGSAHLVDPASLVGERRPDFTLGSTTGERVSASDFDGQLVLLNFWATWCKPCRAEMPMLWELHRQYADRGFQVVGIALDDVQQAREFAAGLGIGYSILVGTADVMATGVDYGNRAGLLPYSVLIDRAGNIRWTRLGELDRAELTGKLENLLLEPL